MEQVIHASVSRTALMRFARAAHRIGVQLHALEIFENDVCIVRWAVAPYRCDDKREVYSLSKSFTSTAVGVAYGMGVLSPGDLVLDYFPEYAPLCADDARWSRLRVGHVLSMNTGHAACVMPKTVFAEDGMRAFFEQPLSHEPGSFFAYNTAATCVAAELVRRTTGRTVPELLARTVFPALGIESFRWEQCADGRCQGGTGLSVSCDDVAKLGLLYLHEGEWQGKQILPRAWAHMVSRLHSSNEGNGTPDWCAGYGYQFWLNRRGGYRGDGAFGQLCVILPEKHCVASVAAECTDMSAELNVLWGLLEHLHDGEGGCAGFTSEGFADAAANSSSTPATSAALTASAISEVSAGPAAPGTDAEPDGAAASCAAEPTGLPERYEPAGALDGKTIDTGWLDMLPNPVGFTGVRVTADRTCARVQFSDEFGVQCVEAPSGKWRENVLFAKNFRPAIVQQMPRTGRSPLRFAAAAHSEADALALECRSLNTPHAFTMRISPWEDGLQIELISPLNVFGEEKLLRAKPPRE